MVFWGIAGVLTLICVILLIWPLLKQSTGRDSSTDYNMKVYEDQLSEVDRDFELGRVNSKELASIKTEIQRRILAENDTAKKYEEPKHFSPSTYIVFTLIISFAIPSFTIGIYANFGSPGLPDIPFSQRTDLTAPNPVTNRAFSKALGRTLKRPAIAPTPGFVLKLIFGEMAQALLLEGQKVLPSRAMETGYRFRFPEVDPALQDLLKRAL